MKPQTYYLYAKVTGEGEMRGPLVPEPSVSFYSEMKTFSGIIPLGRPLLRLHWSEWCHMTSSSCNGGWKRVGRESGMAMDGGWASLRCLSETISLRHGDRNK